MNMTEKRQVVKAMELIHTQKMGKYGVARATEWAAKVKQTKLDQVASVTALEKKARKAADALADVYQQLRATGAVAVSNKLYNVFASSEALFEGVTGVGPSADDKIAFDTATREVAERARDLLDQETLRIWTEGDPQMTVFVERLEAILGHA
ncbi:MAG: hypothetical protein WC822_01185 [Candidatus Paceibacterota bacterium]|jgi:hypothetical protein